MRPHSGPGGEKGTGKRLLQAERKGPLSPPPPAALLTATVLTAWGPAHARENGEKEKEQHPLPPPCEPHFEPELEGALFIRIGCSLPNWGPPRIPTGDTVKETSGNSLLAAWSSSPVCWLPFTRGRLQQPLHVLCSRVRAALRGRDGLPHFIQNRTPPCLPWISADTHTFPRGPGHTTAPLPLLPRKENRPPAGRNRSRRSHLLSEPRSPVLACSVV